MALLQKLHSAFRGRHESEAEKSLRFFLRSNSGFTPALLPDLAARIIFLASGTVPSLDTLERFLPETDPALLEQARKNAANPACAQKICRSLQKSGASLKKELLQNLLLFFPACDPLPEEAEREIRMLAEACGLEEKDVDALFEADREERRRKKDLLNSGTGLLAAVVVILLFFLSAVFVKTVFAGFLLAVLFLPVERLVEKYIFAARWYNTLERILLFPFRPLKHLRRILTSGHAVTKSGPEEKDKTSRALLSMKGAAATILMLLTVCMTLLTALYLLLAPFAKNAGGKISEWFTEISAPAKVQQPAEVQEETAAKPSPPPEEKKDFDHLKQKLQAQLKGTVSNYTQNLSGFIFDSGSDVLTFLLALAGRLGRFAIDLLLTVFFFFAFLQQMAFHTGTSEKTIGSWTVDAVFGSAWLPLTNEETRKSASDIIDHICGMFTSWLRGYFCIIFLEWLLYPFFFLLFDVPYAIPLAMLSGCAVLVPLIGPAFCIGTTYCIVLAFTESHLAFTLTGLTISYLLVNGILEQLILYPTLVGESVGLTIMETIIVVLLSSLFGSIAAMIAAIPTAAIIKYLIPRIYQSLTTAFNPATSDAWTPGKTVRPSD